MMTLLMLYLIPSLVVAGIAAGVFKVRSRQ